MKLRIKKEDAEKAGAYYSNRGCLLCAALKRRFKTNQVSVSALSGMYRQPGKPVRCFTLPELDADKIVLAYGGNCDARPPATMKPFTIELNLY